MRIPEYDDGYDSRESFERAGADRPEDMESDRAGAEDSVFPEPMGEPTTGDIFGWLDDDQLATSIGKELAEALELQSFRGDMTFFTTHGQKTAGGLARLVWALIHDALPNR